MDFRLKKHLLIGLVLIITACASTPQREPIPVGEPGDFTTGSEKADVMYNLLVAELAIQKGLVDIAAKYYLAATETTRDPKVAARAVRVLGFAKDKSGALKAAEIWVAGEPTNTEALEVLGVLYLRNDRFDEAKKTLAALLEKNNDPKSLGSFFLGVGALLQRETAPTAAYELALKLAENYKHIPEANYFVSSMALRVGNSGVAYDYINLAIKGKKSWDQAIILKARILEAMNKTNESLDLLRAYVNRNPKAHDVRNYYASSLLNNNQFKEARSQYELLAMKMPNNTDILFALSVLAYEFKELDEAEGYLIQIDNLGQRTPRESYFLGQIAEDKKNYSQAIEWYSKVLRGQYYLKAQLRIGSCLFQLKSLDEAREHIHKIEPKSEKERVEILRFEGALLKDAKKYEQAFDFYSDAIEEFQGNTDLIYDRALIAERIGKIEQSLKDLRYLVEKQPDNPAVLNALGYTLADRTQQYEEALTLISKALELQPNDPAIMDSMGWVQYRLGNKEDALVYLQKALNVIDDGEVAAHLGEVLWSLGREDEAKKVWKKAWKKFADNKVLKKTMEKHGL